MQTRVHVNLQVADLDRSVTFYERLFGAAPTKRRSDYANFRLDQPALHLALVPAPGRERKDTREHFGVELFEDAELSAWRSRAEAAGLALRTEAQVTCCYAVADKFWARDPDGNEWEFWVRHAEAESMGNETRAKSECCVPARGSEAPARSEER